MIYHYVQLEKVLIAIAKGEDIQSQIALLTSDEKRKLNQLIAEIEGELVYG